jgi:hypothetical protein
MQLKDAIPARGTLLVITSLCILPPLRQIVCHAPDASRFCSGAGLGEQRVGRQVFETKVYRPSHTPSAMNCACGHDDALPWPESQRTTVCQVDLQKSVHDDKELVRMGVLVPGIYPAEYPKAKAARIHSAEYLIPVVVGHGCPFGGDVNDHERWVANWLARICLGRRDGRLHR